jgi:hypothetical protein
MDQLITLTRNPAGGFDPKTGQDVKAVARILPDGEPLDQETLFSAAAKVGRPVRLEPGPPPWSAVVHVKRDRWNAAGPPVYSPLTRADAAVWHRLTARFPLTPPVTGEWFAHLIETAMDSRMAVVLRTDLATNVIPPCPAPPPAETVEAPAGSREHRQGDGSATR